jgi:hypothetical protein
VKRLEREADHSTPFNAEAKNAGILAPFPQMSSYHSTELIRHMNNFTFILMKASLKASNASHITWHFSGVSEKA